MAIGLGAAAATAGLVLALSCATLFAASALTTSLGARTTPASATEASVPQE